MAAVNPILLADLFLGPDPARNYKILAGAEAGAYSIAVGESVWRSVAEKKPINIKGNPIPARMPLYIARFKKKRENRL